MRPAVDWLWSTYSPPPITVALFRELRCTVADEPRRRGGAALLSSDNLHSHIVSTSMACFGAHALLLLACNLVLEPPTAVVQVRRHFTPRQVNSDIIPTPARALARHAETSSPLLNSNRSVPRPFRRLVVMPTSLVRSPRRLQTRLQNRPQLILLFAQRTCLLSTEASPAPHTSWAGSGGQTATLLQEPPTKIQARLNAHGELTILLP